MQPRICRRAREIDRRCPRQNDIENGWAPEFVRGDPANGIKGWESDDRAVLNGESRHAVGETASVKDEIRIFDTIKTPLSGADGEPVALVGVSRDLTESEQAEEVLRRLNQELEERVRERTAQLRDNEERLALALRASQEGVWDWNMETNVVWYSARYKEMLGYDESEIEPHYSAWDRLIHPDDRAQALEVVDAVMRGKADYEMEFRLRHKDGHYIDVLSRGFPVRREPGGPIVRIVGTHIDLTERKAAEAVRQMNAYNRSLIEASLDPLFMIAPDGHITDINQAAEKATGLPRSELIGTYFSNCFTDPEKALSGYQNVLTEGSSQDYELGIRYRDGSATPVLFNAAPYRNEAGQIVGIFAAARNIAARKRAEEEIMELNASLERRVALRTAELVTANKELEAFSYSVSHDLRAPLRAIDGFSQALIEDYADLLDFEGRSLLQRVRAASQRMDQLMDGLLGLSRMSRGEMRVTTVDLSAMARTIAGDLRKAHPEHHVDFVTAPGLVVRGDNALLWALLENLLSNAWKFTGKHPRALVELGAMRRDGKLIYFVRDDGAGFDMAYSSKLFGAFQRLHSPTEFKGTGIGLATVQRIVHRHGGQVWAEGEVGKGAIFYFTIPVDPSST